MVSLAKTFVARNDYASAQKQCGKIIELETEIDDAILLMADVGNQSSSYEDSVSQLAMILKDNPTHYKALERLIELQRRHGKLNDALVFFEHAENRGANRQLEAGYQYCKGIYYRYG